MPLGAPADLLLWQLADSAFPTGGFAHSAGLEAAWQHGEIRHRDELGSFLDASLSQLGHSALPFVTATHVEPQRLTELDQLCEAFTPNHVANRASRLQGRALMSAAERIFISHRVNRSPTQPPVMPALPGDAPADATNTARHDGPTPVVTHPSQIERLPFTHYAPVFGAVLRHLEVSLEPATRLFLFVHLRGVLAAAVRLNIVGPMEAQALQHIFGTRTEQIRARCASLTIDELSQTSPLLDLWQGAHDRLYSRLFQS